MTDDEFKAIAINCRGPVMAVLQACGSRFSVEEAESAYWHATEELWKTQQKAPPTAIKDACAWLYRVAQRKGIDERRKQDTIRTTFPVSIDALQESGALDQTLHGAPDQTASPEDVLLWEGEFGERQSSGQCVARQLEEFARRGPAQSKMVRTIMMKVHRWSAEQIREYNGHASDAAARQYVRQCRKVMQTLVAPCEARTRARVAESAPNGRRP